MSSADETDSSRKDSEIQCIKTVIEYITSDSLFSLNRSEVFATDDVPTFTRNTVICILSECLNELSILHSINLQNDLGTNADKLLRYLSLEDRYMGQENHADYRINCPNSNFDKLAKDVNMLYLILKETCRDMRKFGRYRSMEETVKAFKRMYREEEQLLEDEANQERIIDDLKSLLEEERLVNIRTMDETEDKIQHLRFAAEDIYVYGKHEVQYFEKWEKARLEQNLMKCKEKENFYESTIKDTEDKIVMENRCHKELEAYFEETRNDHLDQIQYWMKKYDEDIDEREGDIISLQADLEKITEERKILSEKYEKRQNEIDHWLAYKEVKEAEERQRILENRAATKIQAWWRGLMVRKKLGRYRKHKKKGKGKAKLKGKKKSKKLK